jgi:hypothetical protein
MDGHGYRLFKGSNAFQNHAIGLRAVNNGPLDSERPWADYVGFETCSVKVSRLYAIGTGKTKPFTVITIVLHGPPQID